MNAWQKNWQKIWQLGLVGMGLILTVGACSATETETAVGESSDSLPLSSVAQESEPPATSQISFYEAVAIAEAAVDGRGLYGRTRKRRRSTDY